MLCPICMKLGECIQLDPWLHVNFMGPIWSNVIEVKGQIHVFSVCSSQVLGPILTKLGGKVEGGPGYTLEGLIF